MLQSISCVYSSPLPFPPPPFLFPSFPLSLLPLSFLPSQTLMIVVAEYDCVPDHRDELGFKEGERIVVTERLNKDWLVGPTTCRKRSSLLVECHNQRNPFYHCSIFGVTQLRKKNTGISLTS